MTRYWSFVSCMEVGSELLFVVVSGLVLSVGRWWGSIEVRGVGIGDGPCSVVEVECGLLLLLRWLG